MSSSGSRSPAAPAAGVLGLFLLLGAFTVPSAMGGDRSSGDDSRPALVVSGNEQGFIRPCGCSKPKLGGIHRRATVLERRAGSHPEQTVVGIGDMVVTGGRQQEIKLETFLLAMAQMGYAAFAPGRGELRQGLDRLQELAGMVAFPFVCANLESPGGEAVFPRRADIGGCVFVGLLPEDAEAPGARVEDLKTGLQKALRGVGEDVWVIVGLAGGEAAARQVAALVPEARRARTTVVFGGVADEPVVVATKTSPAVVSIGSKGRHLAVIRPGGEEVLESIILKEEIPAHEVVGQMLDGYRQALKDEDLVARVPRTEPEAEYVGESTCVECHKETCTLLDKTGHEHAFATLVASGDQYDPECVRCHVTGWGDKGGYLGPDATPGMRNVTCEACHGPGRRHVELMEPTVAGSLDGGMCLRCHDPDNSPQFDFKRYWPKIAHPPR